MEQCISMMRLKKKIKYYAARNEAAAPMMAEAYAKYKNSIGAVCVTAGSWCY